MRNWIRSFPLRTRLILAFVALIVSSASATIVIGNEVFGRKVEELAGDLLTAYVKLAAQALDARLEQMRLAARDVAARYSETGNGAVSATLAAEEADFILVGEPPDSWLVFPTGRDKPAFAADQIRRLALGSVAGVFDAAVRTNGAVAAIAGVPGEQFAQFHDGVLLHVAAAPLARSGTGGVVLLRVLNGRNEFLNQLQWPSPDRRKGNLAVMLFLGDREVASTGGGTGAQADATVIESVLRRGEPLAGKSKLAGRNFYAAFSPLKDHAGNVVGMLAAGSSEDAMAEIRKRTTSLFASLIAGGMIFGFIMTFLFSAWLVSPITELAEGMSRVAEGDLSYKVRIESADELGKLARAFNQMVRAVKERDHKLREMTEDRLTQVEKQISIGRLAAGVAHEINNPLTAILTLSTLWLRKSPEGDRRREDLEIIVAETSRCRDIVRNLLDFARERPMEKCVSDINGILRETLMLAHNYGAISNVRVELHAAEMPLRVNADPKLLQQVFINLLINAAEATDPGGIVRLEADEDSSGGFVQVRVVDQGRGIAKEHLDRVFEPFFTTKGIGKGTGLGLSVSLGIIQKHGGTIEIDSAEGKGTIVTVLLPRVAEVQS